MIAWKQWAAVVFLAAVVVAHTSGAQQDAPPSAAIPVEVNGGAAGGNAIVVNGWDIRGVRNIQGGWLDGHAGDLNLDIGAGSTANPGDIALNYDVGRSTLVYDGHRHLLARFGPRGITFYVRPRVAGVARWPAWRRGKR